MRAASLLTKKEPGHMDLSGASEGFGPAGRGKPASVLVARLPEKYYILYTRRIEQKTHRKSRKTRQKKVEKSGIHYCVCRFFFVPLHGI